MKYEVYRCDRCGVEDTNKKLFTTFSEEERKGSIRNDPASGRTEYPTFEADLCTTCVASFAEFMARTLVAAGKTPFADFICHSEWLYKPTAEF